MSTATTNIIVAQLLKGDRAEVRVTLSEFKGRHTIDLRIFETFAGTTDARAPTKAGVTMAVERLPELRAALEEAERQAEALGLIAKGRAQ
jgi:hypothetical protein